MPISQATYNIAQNMDDSVVTMQLSSPGAHISVVFSAQGFHQHLT